MKRDLKRNISPFARCRRYLVSASRPPLERALSMDRATSARLACFTSSCEVARLSIFVIPFHGHDRARRFAKRASVRVAELPIVAPLADGLRPAAQVDLMFHAQTPALARRSHRHYSEMCLGNSPKFARRHSRLEPVWRTQPRLRVKAKHFRLS